MNFSLLKGWGVGLLYLYSFNLLRPVGDIHNHHIKKIHCSHTVHVRVVYLRTNEEHTYTHTYIHTYIQTYIQRSHCGN